MESFLALSKMDNGYKVSLLAQSKTIFFHSTFFLLTALLEKKKFSPEKNELRDCCNERV
jgi:hypothetical protein